MPGHAKAVVDAAALALKPAAARAPSLKPLAKPLSGAAKRKLRAQKAATRELKLDEVLAERRAAEAAAAEAAIVALELEVEALALAAIAARRALRRPAAQACLELMEAERAAKRRCTRRARRSLQRVEARRLERLEDAMTLDALEVESAAAAAFVERVEAQRAELTEGVECVAVRTWAERDAETRARAVVLE